MTAKRLISRTAKFSEARAAICFLQDAARALSCFSSCNGLRPSAQDAVRGIRDEVESLRVRILDEWEEFEEVDQAWKRKRKRGG